MVAADIREQLPRAASAHDSISEEWCDSRDAIIELIGEAFRQGLSLNEISELTGWTPERVHCAYRGGGREFA